MNWNEWNETERINEFQYSNEISNGQTLMVRYYMILNGEESFDLKFDLTTNIDSSIALSDAFEVSKFFVASAGYNFPCLHPKLGSTDFLFNDYWVPIGAKLNIGDIDKLSLFQKNISANMVLKRY